MLNDKAGWAVGAGGAVVGTADGGNWVVQTSNVPNSNGMPEPIWDVHFADKNIGIAAAEFGVILRTKDGGITWAPLETRPVAARLQGVHMISASEAWIVGDKATILHTTDGGETWDIISSASDLRSVYFHNDMLGWAVGEAGSVLHTDDGGETWQPRIVGTFLISTESGLLMKTQVILLEPMQHWLKQRMVAKLGTESATQGMKATARPSASNSMTP